MVMIIKTLEIYVFTQPLRHRQDVTQGEFLNGAQLVLIQCFLWWGLIKKYKNEMNKFKSKFPVRPLTGSEISSCLKRWSSWRQKEFLIQ